MATRKVKLRNREKHRSNSKKAFQDSPLTFSNTPKASNFPRNGKETRSQSVEMVLLGDLIFIVIFTFTKFYKKL